MNNLENKWSEQELAEYELSEQDFYPPEDKRIFHSGVSNTDGDCYEDFAQDYNDMCEQEEMYEL